MTTSDIESALNMVTYIYRYDEFYRGVHIVIVQKEDCMWLVIYQDKPLHHEHESYGHAMAYAMGYIDGIIGSRRNYDYQREADTQINIHC